MAFLGLAAAFEPNGWSGILPGGGAGIFLKVPRQCRTWGWMNYCIGPFAYLYVRAMVKRLDSFQRWDFLHFLPAMVHLVEFMPYYFMELEAKCAHVEQHFTHPELIAQVSEGLLPPYAHNTLKPIQLLDY